LYKISTGYQTTNASISIECARKKNLFAVSTTLTKGERGTVALYDAWARIGHQSGEFESKRFVGIERLNFDAPLDPKDVIWWKTNDAHPINLTPGEKASFSCVFWFFQINFSK
jgi:hypothetical protein